MRVFLETERLVLRQFTMNDVDHLVELDGDPQVMHFITGGRTTPAPTRCASTWRWRSTTVSAMA